MIEKKKVAAEKKGRARAGGGKTPPPADGDVSFCGGGTGLVPVLSSTAWNVFACDGVAGPPPPPLRKKRDVKKKTTTKKKIVVSFVDVAMAEVAEAEAAEEGEAAADDGVAEETTASKPALLRLCQMSTADFATNVGAILASSVPESKKEARLLVARDYRGIHLFADPCTGEVYNPDDIMGKVINPRTLDPDLVERLGPWVPSTGLGNGGGGGGELAEDDEDE